MGSEDHFADSRELLDYGAGSMTLQDRWRSPLLPKQGGRAVGVTMRSPPMSRSASPLLRSCGTGEVRSTELRGHRRPVAMSRRDSATLLPVVFGGSDECGDLRRGRSRSPVAASESTELGAEISPDYAGRAPISSACSTDRSCFLADLIRQHGRSPSRSTSCHSPGLARKAGSALRWTRQLSLEGRDVIIVEDIVDTGLTLTAMRRMLELRDVASLATVRSSTRRQRRIVDVPLEYRGFEIGDEFLLGYGLDWDGRYRNLRSCGP